MNDTRCRKSDRDGILPIRLGRSAIQAIIRAKNRRTAIRALMALDNHLLRDVGLDRGQIPSVVDSLLDRGIPRLEGILASATEPKCAVDRDKFPSAA